MSSAKIEKSESYHSSGIGERPLCFALASRSAERTGRTPAHSIDVIVSTTPIVVTLGSLKGTESVAEAMTENTDTMIGHG